MVSICEIELAFAFLSHNSSSFCFVSCEGDFYFTRALKEMKILKSLFI